MVKDYLSMSTHTPEKESEIYVDHIQIERLEKVEGSLEKVVEVRNGMSAGFSPFAKHDLPFFIY